MRVLPGLDIGTDQKEAQAGGQVVGDETANSNQMTRSDSHIEPDPTPPVESVFDALKESPSSRTSSFNASQRCRSGPSTGCESRGDGCNEVE